MKHLLRDIISRSTRRYRVSKSCPNQNTLLSPSLFDQKLSPPLRPLTGTAVGSRKARLMADLSALIRFSYLSASGLCQLIYFAIKNELFIVFVVIIGRGRRGDTDADGWSAPACPPAARSESQQLVVGMSARTVLLSYLSLLPIFHSWEEKNRIVVE